MKKLYGPTNSIPLQDQYKYKILFDIDGHTYSARFATLLTESGSAVFKIAAF